MAWNAIITGYVKSECISDALVALGKMRLQHVDPDEVTFICILEGCASIANYNEGREVHAYAIENGLVLNVAVGNSLIDMYSKCGNLEDGCIIFHGMCRRNMVTWNTLISSHIKHGYFHKAIFYLERMQEHGFKPDSVTFLSISKLLSSFGDSEHVKQVHMAILEIGFESVLNIGNAIIDMYAKCGDLKAGNNMFNKIATSDIVTWTSLATGYVQHGFYQEAFQIFNRMQHEGIQPLESTFLCSLKACSVPQCLCQGRHLHAQLIELGMGLDVLLANTLIDMYGKCGNLEDACIVFNRVPTQDVVSWNVLIGAYSEHDKDKDILELFEQMQCKGTKPTTTTFVYLLKACKKLVKTYNGFCIQALIIECGFEENLYIGSALVGMYAEWGCVSNASIVFQRIPQLDIVTWTSLMSGYIEHGYCTEALHLFQYMRKGGLEPTLISISCALHARMKMSALEEGRQIHIYIIESGI